MAEDSSSVQRKLQPWLQGVIAVTVFLVLTVIALVINKIWCQDKDESLEDSNKNMRGNKKDLNISKGTEGNYSATAADFRCEEGHHVYENTVVLECGNTTECHVENHVEVLTTCM
ncbi:PDZK1-interacting protein 1 [Varanus komodoensis]|uniref:PDZK1-interacting protein 1 n=1 Tax=Varanus komodoensis TaxID=61221 RepID=UPI001CF7E310|nr:PDZK1-interacting protein 1 [Varanus komodoensis]